MARQARQDRKELTEIWQALGDATLEEAQRHVPVDTGQLKNSASVTATHKGFTIKYDTDYAATVHHGEVPDHVEVGKNHVQKVPAHWRKTSKGKVKVKAHTKTFTQGHAPSKISQTEWRSIPWNLSTRKNYWQSQYPQWLTEAWKVVKTKQLTKLFKEWGIKLPANITIRTGHR